MPYNNSPDTVRRYSSEDIITSSRIWLLLVSDVLVLLVALLAGVTVLLRGFTLFSVDVLVAATVASAAIISLILLKRNKPVAATHVTVATVFLALWILNLLTASRSNMRTELVYLIAALTLPAFLLGVGYTIFYGVISAIITAWVAWFLVLNNILSMDLAYGFATDYILSLMFTAAYVSAIAAIYEKAVTHIKHLLSSQQEVTVELARLNDEIRQSEAQKKQFYRDTISSVTDGKFLIADSDELQEYQANAQFQAEIHSYADTSSVRQRVSEYFAANDLSKNDLFLTGLGEAMTNAVKHAGGGLVFAGSDINRIWAGVSDNGPGITTMHLPSVALRRGYSSTVSMGMGYSIMLDVSDCVMLSTGPSGTTVVLVKLSGTHQPSVTLATLPDTWDSI